MDPQRRVDISLPITARQHTPDSAVELLLGEYPAIIVDTWATLAHLGAIMIQLAADHDTNVTVTQPHKDNT